MVKSNQKAKQKADLGVKRTCPECGGKFYDLSRRPALCPLCRCSYDPDTIEKPVVIEPLKPEMNTKEPNTGHEDDDEEEDVGEEDIDEEEVVAKELELDGDDAALIGSDDEGDEGSPSLDGFQTGEDDDEDAALVDDDGDELPPTGDDEDDPEEIEI